MRSMRNVWKSRRKDRQKDSLPLPAAVWSAVRRQGLPEKQPGNDERMVRKAAGTEDGGFSGLIFMRAECRRHSAHISMRAECRRHSARTSVHQQQKPFPFPQQHSSRRIQIISLPHPLPQFAPPMFDPPFPPQQHSRRIRKIMLQPFPPVVQSHPQPQFVAAKSLMFRSSRYSDYTSSYVCLLATVSVFWENSCIFI